MASALPVPCVCFQAPALCGALSASVARRLVDRRAHSAFSRRTYRRGLERPAHRVFWRLRWLRPSWYGADLTIATTAAACRHVPGASGVHPRPAVPALWAVPTLERCVSGVRVNCHQLFSFRLSASLVLRLSLSAVSRAQCGDSRVLFPVGLPWRRTRPSWSRCGVRAAFYTVLSTAAALSVDVLTLEYGRSSKLRYR